MIRLKESIHIAKDIKSVFDYVGDFSHIQEWDPGVSSSEKREPGETGVGANLDLILKFGPFRPKMRYTITSYLPCSRVVLKGKADSFSAVDTIVFNKTATGTQIDYQADIRFSGLAGYMEWFLSPVLKQTGRNAMQGLEQAFGESKGMPGAGGWFRSGTTWPDFLADHAVVPGMLMFSRFGYAFSKRFWTEPGRTLYGKKVVLTGGTSGIGKAAAFKLAEKKAFLTLVARNREKAEQVRRAIIQKTGNPHVDVVVADLGLMQEVAHAAGQIQKSNKSIDILINNAGALFNERKETLEGLEQTFATDLAGVFLLTMLLKNALAGSSGARIINVSSGGMYTQKIDVDDLENRKGVYNGAKAYARAKRGIVILTQIWAGRFKKYGITVHAMHPGWVDTPGIERSLSKFHQRMRRILRTPEQGADTIVWLALSEKATQSTGRFWLDRRPRETVVFPGTSESEKERQVLWEKLNSLMSRSG